MAYCASCGNQISDLASSCPRCGHPTGIPMQQSVYAGFWRRAAASLLDGLILGIAGIFLASGRNLGGALAGFLYNWLMIAFNDGRTIGKMALGVRIARPDGSSVDLGTAAARAGMALVSGLVFGLGYLWAAFDSQNRTWHDRVADTRAFTVR